ERTRGPLAALRSRDPGRPREAAASCVQLEQRVFALRMLNRLAEDPAAGAVVRDQGDDEVLKADRKELLDGPVEDGSAEPAALRAGRNADGMIDGPPRPRPAQGELESRPRAG